MEAVDNPSYFCTSERCSVIMGGAVSAAPPPPSASTQQQHRRSRFRSLLRSVSAHEHVPQQLLVLGQPRPSDKEPARMLTHHCAGSSTQVSRPVSGRISSQVGRRQQSSLELLSNDMVFCSPDAVLPGGDVRYYNLTMPMASRRRHSIGAFLKSSMTTKPTHKQPRKTTRGNRCGKCQAPQGKMCDILLVSSKSSQAAKTWVNYLRSCFEEISKQKKRLPYNVEQQYIEDLGKTGSNLSGLRSRLQIVVLCPVLLQALCDQPSNALASVLQPERVLGMLLGVEGNSLSEEQKATLPSYDDWKRLVVKDQDESFVGMFLQEAMVILSQPLKHHCKSEKAAFTLTPKKVKHGQDKVLVLLSQPVSKEDSMRVTMDNQGDMLEVTEVKLRNPYTLSFTVPATCLQVSMLASVVVYKNQQSLGSRLIKCESRMRELEQLLHSVSNPMQLMCQTLGFKEREQLDNYLVSAFQRNLPPHFNLLQTPPEISRNDSNNEECPTLLHFAAQHGLERLAWQLLECPGGEAACDIRNCNDQLPADLAEVSGHTKLAMQLRGYMQMTEFTSIYSYLKVMTEGSENQQGDYHHPRPLSETYQVPRSPLTETYQVPRSPFTETYQIPRSPEDNYQIPPPARSYCPPPSSEGWGYMHMSNLEPPTLEVQPMKDTQDELVEIINDFKNNIFSIAEAEKLVSNWKSRKDVQQSFKDKQIQLAEMSAEHERLQRQLQEKMKNKDKPFERIRSFFRGNKSRDEEVDRNRSISMIMSQQRPGSSLSIHSITSSTSSGRMSVASACSGASISDSGTHSDPEERMRNAMRYYEIPPAPIPIIKTPRLPVPSFQAPNAPTIEERPPCPLPRPEPSLSLPDDEVYYIATSFAGNVAAEPSTSTYSSQQAASMDSVSEQAEYLSLDEADDEVPMRDYMNMPPVPGPKPKR